MALEADWKVKGTSEKKYLRITRTGAIRKEKTQSGGGNLSPEKQEPKHRMFVEYEVLDDDGNTIGSGRHISDTEIDPLLQEAYTKLKAELPATRNATDL